MNNDLLKAEKKILDRIIYRSKNQHKSSLRLRRMIHLQRLMAKNAPLTKIKNCCQDLYIICSNDLVLGHFIPINTVLMALSGRVFYLIGKVSKPSTIDQLFSKLDGSKK